MFQVGELAWHQLFLRRRRHLAPMAFFLIAGIMSFVFSSFCLGSTPSLFCCCHCCCCHGYCWSMLTAHSLYCSTNLSLKKYEAALKRACRHEMAWLGGCKLSLVILATKLSFRDFSEVFRSQLKVNTDVERNNLASSFQHCNNPFSRDRKCSNERESLAIRHYRKGMMEE